MMGRVFTKADLVGANRFNAKDLLGRSCMIKVDHGEREGKVFAHSEVNSAISRTIAPDHSAKSAAGVLRSLVSRHPAGHCCSHPSPRPCKMAV